MTLTKKLTKVGSSKALILDKTLLQLLGVTENDTVSVTMQDGGVMIHAHIPKETDEKEVKKRMEKALECTMKKYDGVYKRLSQS